MVACDSDTTTGGVLNLLETAEACGADVIATECPTCHSGLEMHQIRAETNFERSRGEGWRAFTGMLADG